MPWPMRLGPLPRMMTFGRSPGGHLVLVVVGRVQVGRAGGELGRAGVHGLEHRPDAQVVPEPADLFLRHAPELAELGI